MSDRIVTALTSDLSVRAYAVNMTGAVQRAHEIHNTGALASAALGRVLCACSMMGYMLKGADETISVQFNGDGPLGPLMGAADSSGCVWGYVSEPLAELPLRSDGKINVGRGVGKGTLSVVRSIPGVEPYCSQVPIATGEIGDDITSYYASSEQTGTVCALGVLVDRDYSIKAAGGYIIQLMPFVGEDVIDKVEKGIGEIPPVTSMLSGGFSPAEMLKKALKYFDGVDILDDREVSYRCRCTREKVEKALISIGYDEIKRLHDEDGSIEMGCRFCDRKYVFSSEELERLLRRTKKN